MTEQVTTATAADRVFHEWHDRARALDVEGLIELYAADATLESPLVPAILDIPSGVCRGHAELRHFYEQGTRRRPNDLVRWHRSGRYLWDGATLSWEYPRALVDGEQVDIAEFMDLDANGLIAHHRIYWGWFGFRLLLTNALKKASDEPWADWPIGGGAEEY